MEFRRIKEKSGKFVLPKNISEYKESILNFDKSGKLFVLLSLIGRFPN